MWLRNKSDPNMVGPSQFRREAQKAYENKEYTEALAILDKALASGPFPQDEALAVLDLRVSIFLKLDDRVTARKIATQMVRTNRADGRGYIRLGQLERLTRDYAAAMTWYDYGLKKVPKSDKLHAYIIVQHTKTMALLKAQTVLSKPVDPFAKLPAEIVEMVVSFFNYQEAVLCLRVSKMWRHVFSTYSVLRNTLDFSHVGKGRREFPCHG
jgi:F-box/TPR repeat protein Pof3